MWDGVSDEAINKIASMLESENDLEKTSQFKNQIVQEKSTTDIKLKTVFKEQILTTMDGLKTLQFASNNINKIKLNFNNISQIANENKELILDYEIINQANKVYEFFTKVNTLYNQVLTFQSEIDSINRLINQDLGIEIPDDFQEIEETIDLDMENTKLPNLFKIHYKLNKLRDLKDQFDEYSSFLSNNDKQAVTKLLDPLKYVTKKFDKILDEIVSTLIETCKENNVELVMILFKILDMEEREDLKINCTLTIVDHRVLGLIRKNMEDQRMIFTLGSKIDESPNGDNLSLNSSNNSQNKPKLTLKQQQIYDLNFSNIKTQLMQNNSITRLKPRNYLAWFFKMIEKTVEETFTNCHEHFKDLAKDQPGLYFDILNNLDWIFDDLTMVKHYIEVNLCPKRWKIFDKVFDMYLRNGQKLLNSIINMEPETLIILEILNYDKKFSAFLINELQFNKKNVKSVIGAEQKEKLLLDYKKLIISKMQDWMTNIKNKEQQLFVKRDLPPEIDEDGYLMFEGSNVVFKMFIQQADVAAGSNQGKILSGVIIDFCKILIERQDEWSKLVNNEVNKLLEFNNNDDNNANFPGGLIEYIVTLANDQIRGIELIESVKEKYIKMVSKKYNKLMEENLDFVIDGFINLSKDNLNSLMIVMFDDLKLPYSEIFMKHWYNDAGNQAKQITDTLIEYINDFQPLLMPLLFDIIIENIIDEVLINYLKSLQNKHIHSNFSSSDKKLKIIEKIKLDVSIFFENFSPFINNLELKFRIIEYLIDFIYLENNEEIIDKFKEMVVDFNDVPIDLLVKILKVKKVGSKDTDYVLEACNNAKNEYLSNLSDPIPTFLQNLKFDR